MKKFAVVLMLAFGVSACSLPVDSDGKAGGPMAENAKSDCGTIIMLRAADVREGFSRDLGCGEGNAENAASGRGCFQYTVLLDHGGSFMIAQRQIPSLTPGTRVCIEPDASGRSEVMRSE